MDYYIKEAKAFIDKDEIKIIFLNQNLRTNYT